MRRLTIDIVFDSQAADASPWSSGKHPRGKPHNRGQFAAKGQGGAGTPTTRRHRAPQAGSAPQAAQRQTAPGVGLVAAGGAKAVTALAAWQAASPFATVSALLQRTPAAQERLASLAAAVSQATGAKFVDPGVKSREGVMRKAQKYGGNVRRITDAVRGGFYIGSPQQADHVVAELSRHVSVIDEGWRMTAAGYFDRSLKVRFPDGLIGEVQLWHPIMYDTKENGGGHALYEQARTLPNGNPQKAGLEAKMRALYAQARAKLPHAFAAVFGTGGSPPKTLANSAEVMT